MIKSPWVWIHERLTTGVHGITLVYPAESSIQGLDLASHRARHQWAGADRALLAELLANMSRHTYIDFQTNDAFTASNLGSGSITWVLLSTDFRTGTTIDSRSYAYTGLIGPAAMGYRIMFRAVTISDQTDCVIWLAFHRETPPTDTGQHMGFKIVNGLIYASNADGTTQKITSTGVTVGSWNDAICYMERVGNSILYYVNGVLKVTHTENLPTQDMRLAVCITNQVAADRRVRLQVIVLMVD